MAHHLIVKVHHPQDPQLGLSTLHGTHEMADLHTTISLWIWNMVDSNKIPRNARHRARTATMSPKYLLDHEEGVRCLHLEAEEDRH